ncbi:sensor histidine kinase [Micromonospora mirobrigensis]|uniref:histidine kinase n=1 Tax=Micromonospora mirobrigensis TaxID=262898 RepID=A0A1C4Z649_9ACTN|nr:histidine kinase [Micromonospora mirobrigensis]SCF28396.1 Signal transduction histidine kinase [Micromonospora mirobrigensis]
MAELTTDGRWSRAVGVARWSRSVAGVALGVPTAVAEVLFLLVAAVAVVAVSPAPLVRRRLGARIVRYARRIADWERRRLAVTSDEPAPPPIRASGPRVFGYLAARVVPATLAMLTTGLLLVGAVLAVIVVRSFVAGTMTVTGLLLQLLIGTVLLIVNLQAMAGVATLDRALARSLLETSTRDALQRRISELAVSRAGVIAAVDAERQRIERDLHDGLQQHLVALGMLVGRARRTRDPDQARELLTQAHEVTQRAVDELREVAWRVYPAALDHTTLDEVLGMVAQRSTTPVRISYEVPVRPARPVETVLYFVACEAITNATKHASATLITVAIEARDGRIEMRVGDDGTGGADPQGSGLQGIARRVVALDGRFDLDSPPGGPTTVRAELPCG